MTNNQNPFSDLMNRYGEEAQQERIRQAKAERRAEFFRKVRKFGLLLMFAGAFVAAALYHNEATAAVTSVTEKVTGKLHESSSYGKAEENTKSKLANIQEQAKKNNDIVESTYSNK